MSTSPTIGEGVWVEPELPNDNLETLIDVFQAQTIVREQDVVELTKVCDTLRDAQTKFESQNLTPAELLSILAEYKSDEFKLKHPDELMQQALLRVITKFEEKVA
jgi:hypothetical protein